MGEQDGGYPALSPRPPPLPPAAPAGRTRWPAEGYWPPGVPRTVLTLHLAAVALMALSQLAVTMILWGASEQRSLLAATTLAKTTVAALVFVRPAAYWQCRAILIPAVRIMFHCLPHMRQPKIGVSMLLERAAQPGLLGALADLARLAVGTRQLGISAGGIALSLTPATTLLQQSVLLMLITNNSAYCVSPLLEHPLSQRRAALLAAGLEYVSRPILFPLPLAGHTQELATALLAGKVAAGKVCHATLSFVQVTLCVLLPTLLSVHSWEAGQVGHSAAQAVARGLERSAHRPGGDGGSSDGGLVGSTDDEDDDAGDSEGFSFDLDGSPFLDSSSLSSDSSSNSRSSGHAGSRRGGRRSSGGADSGGGRDHSMAAGTAAGTTGWTGQCLQRLSRASDAADRGLCYILQRPTGAGPWLVVCWWLLSICWLACRQLAGL